MASTSCGMSHATSKTKGGIYSPSPDVNCFTIFQHFPPLNPLWVRNDEYCKSLIRVDFQLEYVIIWGGIWGNIICFLITNPIPWLGVSLGVAPKLIHLQDGLPLSNSDQTPLSGTILLFSRWRNLAQSIRQDLIGFELSTNEYEEAAFLSQFMQGFYRCAFSESCPILNCSFTGSAECASSSFVGRVIKLSRDVVVNN